jgi:hypothetical protein
MLVPALLVFVHAGAASFDGHVRVHGFMIRDEDVDELEC